MARLPRLVQADRMHYVAQFAHEGISLFRDADDYQILRKWLLEASRQFKVAVHCYAFLPTGLQFLVTPTDGTGLARMMQWLGRHYVPYFNRKYGRSGGLWQGRFRTTIIEPARYFVDCCRYIEAAPYRAGIVAEVGAYTWSSYRHHAGLQVDYILHDPPQYWALGNTPFEREANYVTHLEQVLTSSELKHLQGVLGKGWVLGSDAFIAEVEAETERRARPVGRGRPRKQIQDQVGQVLEASTSTSGSEIAG